MEPYFIEFESGESVAAQITHEVDSLDCRVQAFMYILRYPEFEKLFEILKSIPKAAYFQDLTNLLLKKETSLREKLSQEKQSRLTIMFGLVRPSKFALPYLLLLLRWSRCMQRYPVQ